MTTHKTGYLEGRGTRVKSGTPCPLVLGHETVVNRKMKTAFAVSDRELFCRDAILDCWEDLSVKKRHHYTNALGTALEN